MTYLVMECYKSYSVVLDSEGRFIKVANLNYEVGQRLDRVYKLEEETSPTNEKKKAGIKKYMAILSLAAAFILIFTNMNNLSKESVASVFMKINPEVRLDINRAEKVVSLLGLNEDGKILIEGYQYKNKKLDLVLDDLIDRAIERGYLYDQGKINIKLDGQDQDYIDRKKGEINNHLNNYIEENISIEIRLSTSDSDYDMDQTIPIEEDEKIIIPVENKNSYQNDDTDYGDSQYEIDDQTDYDDEKVDDQTDYDDEIDGQTDYDDDEVEDTNYDESDYD